MQISFIGEGAEKWIIEYINNNGLEGLFFVYLISLALAGFLGWLLSGFTRVADLRKTLAETGKIHGEVSSQKEVLLTSIRQSRDNLVSEGAILESKLIDLRTRLEKGQNNKADELREQVCSQLIGPYWRALEDHCERADYLLTRHLRHREISKTIIPKLESTGNILVTINNPKLLNLVGNRTQLLLRSSTLNPILTTIGSICPWWKPWTWKVYNQINDRFKPHMRKDSAIET